MENKNKNNNIKNKKNNNIKNNSEVLITEKPNPNSYNLDILSTYEILDLINKEDFNVPKAIKKALKDIEKTVNIIVEKLKKGGRLFLCGAGTSGRIAIMEAAECPPTFSTPPNLIQAIMAGAPDSFFKAVEKAEDSYENGKKDIKKRNISYKDVIIGISASGKTPYVLGSLDYAKDIGAVRILITSNKIRDDKDIADIIIFLNTGPEILTGSTRMKAGSAAKMVLNMITTTTMIKLGKVYKNLMIDVNPNSNKLINRAINIIKEITNCSLEDAKKLLEESNNPKIAIVMYKKNITKEQAENLLKYKTLREILE